jgi:D-alanyl-D-alanine carboxypeptidase (penicillin-binding protein 5/6)
MRRLLIAFLTLTLLGAASRAAIPPVSKDPYLGAIVVDADTGDVLFAERADEKGYPASMLKLMDLLLILEYVEQGRLHYTDVVKVTVEASKVGGSQVYLDPRESFPLEELLYALMVQSANDAATALAIHVAGSKDGFIELMNKRAAELGMTSTRFNSVHGLPPSQDAQPDVTTARDFALLCREVLKHPDALKFTSTARRPFRASSPKPFIMDNHNNLLGVFEGCDGLKTGYTTSGGYSMAVTARRGENRVLCVILGSKDRKVRDSKASALMARGFLIMPPKAKPPPPPPVVTNFPPPVPEPVPEPVRTGVSWWIVLVAALAVLALGGGAVWYFRFRPRRRGDFVRRTPS